MPVIECGCGHCKLTLAEDCPRMSLCCECKDCPASAEMGGKAGRENACGFAATDVHALRHFGS